jgi:hypothetical protein
MLTNAQWAAYRQVINAASLSFNQEVIIWNRASIKLDRDGDDTIKPTFFQQPLNALIQYNVARTWPIDKSTDTGLIDNQSVAIILNKDYLAGLGFINPSNNFDFDPGFDYFTVQGVNYKKMGDTPAAQAGDDPLLVYLICERMRVESAQPHYGPASGITPEVD